MFRKQEDLIKRKETENMNLEQFFRARREVFPQVPNGETSTVGDFFKQCTAGVRLSPEMIVKWHRMLVSYSNPKKNNRLPVRLHESVRINGAYETRRGAVTRMQDGFEYVFASNYFARVIYSMGKEGYVPEEEDFADMINNRKVCISYPLHVNPGEQEISAYPSRIVNARYSTQGLYTPSWYLAHIADVNNVRRVPYRGFEGVRPRDVMSSGKMADWEMVNGMPVRQLKENLGEKRAIVRANFLRFLDPINYFLVPSRKFEKHEVGSGVLGEASDVVAYAKQRMISEVEKISHGIYDEFCDIALISKKEYEERSVEQLGSVRMMVRFSSRQINENGNVKSATITAKEKNRCEKKLSISDKLLEDVVRAYLEEGKSYRRIECDILGIEGKKRGGGFVAKALLNGLGISSAEKRVFAQVSPQEFVENCSDPLRSILNKMYLDK